MQASVWSLNLPSSRVDANSAPFRCRSLRSKICFWSEVLTLFYLHCVKLYLTFDEKMWSLNEYFFIFWWSGIDSQRWSCRKSVEKVSKSGGRKFSFILFTFISSTRRTKTNKDCRSRVFSYTIFTVNACCNRKMYSKRHYSTVADTANYMAAY
jgi:hypothetical protein